MPLVPPEEALERFNERPSIPLYYINGYGLSSTSTDINIRFQINEQPMVALIMTPSVAVTLAKQLLALVSEFEEKSGLKITPMDEITAKLAKAKK